MLNLIERIAASETTSKGLHSLTLPFDQRQKSRFRARLDGSNEATRAEVFVLLERGHILRHGDILRADDGTEVRIIAAREALSVVKSRDPLALLRAAYHLGNRHIQLQIEPGRLAYQHDHVLDGMVRSLGLEVGYDEAPFEPEAGAYGGHAHGHSHAHAHSHEHVHDQDHAHTHEHGHAHEHHHHHAGEGRSGRRHDH